MADRMKDFVKDTLEQDVPDVLSKIKASPQFNVPEKTTGFSLLSMSRRKMALSALSVFVLLLVFVGVYNRLATPVVATTVTLDLNPSIEITLDEDDKVIDVTALNNDGEEIVQRNIRYWRKSLDEVIDILVDRLENRGYIVDTSSENNIILIEVSADDTTRRDRIELAVKNKLEARIGDKMAPYWVLNARELKLTKEQKDMIKNDPNLARYSKAKLALVYRIITLDDSYTMPDLLPLKIRELYTIFINLESPDNLPDYDQMPGHPPRHDPHHNSSTHSSA